MFATRLEFSPLTGGFFYLKIHLFAENCKDKYNNNIKGGECNMKKCKEEVLKDLIDQGKSIREIAEEIKKYNRKREQERIAAEIRRITRNTFKAREV